MPTKLDSGQKHLLTLIAHGASADCWAPVSKQVMPLLYKMPKELIDVEELEEGRGRARLTEEGTNLLAAMEWL